VLDADAFNAFKQTDLFNQDLAGKFRKYLLGLSGTDDTMKLYRQFRGQEPEIQPLLNRRGLN
jgi:peptidyl-dipeptidase Dcp